MNYRYLNSFFNSYPEFTIEPLKENEIVLKGNLNKKVFNESYGELILNYNLLIIIPFSYPKLPPRVYETGDKIDSISNNHINPDGTFCLGSSVRLTLHLKKYGDFKVFFEKIVLPYLYAVTHKLKGGEFIFGELDHGKKGLLTDFMDLFSLDHEQKVNQMLTILSSNKKEANKMKCPCGCTRKVTQCLYFNRVIQMRRALTKEQWQQENDFFIRA